MNKVLIFLLFFFIPFLSISQTKKVSVIEDTAMAMIKEDSLMSIIKKVQDSLLFLRQKIDDCQQELQKKEKELTTCQAENEKNKLKVTRADTLTIRIMNNRLISRYSKVNVSDALNDYYNISNENLKKEYKYREELLKGYELYYNQLLDFIIQIQKDPMRINKFQMDEYKKLCNSSLKRLSYYQLVYLSKDKNYKIPYLDHIIDLVKKELNRHGSIDRATGREYITDFTIILREMKGDY